MNYSLGNFLNPIPTWNLPEKRKIFVSYHHENDQDYYDKLSTLLEKDYVPIYDNSLDRNVESDNSDYVIQRIRDNYIKGTSCTIVLCGSESSQRKYIDWEIKGTLEKEHGLLGIALPTCPTDLAGKYYVPGRLYDNIASGYAQLIMWSTLFPPITLANMMTIPPIIGNTLKSYIDNAALKPKKLILNTRENMNRNGEPK